MKDTAALLGALILGCAALLSADAQAQTAASDADAPRAYALIVANNSSVDEGVEPLEFADDDGARYYELFSNLVDDTTLLTTLDADSQRVFGELAAKTRPPSRAGLKRAVDRLADRIAADRKAGRASEVYLVFTGHGNVEASGEGYLSLQDGKLRRSDLYREVIRPLGADYTHLIVDACHSYFMVKSRGGDWKDDAAGQDYEEDLQAYLNTRASADEWSGATIGVIVSTSGTAEVHEWSRFRAGVFSHQLRSAMLGAADADGDGEVTYAEIEAYLVAANAGVTNPRARINVYAEPPAQDRGRAVIDLDSYRHATRLELEQGQGGRYFVEDARGLRYADFHAGPTQPTSLVLLRRPTAGKPYFLYRGDEQAPVPVTAGRVDATELAFAAIGEQSRGTVDEAFRNQLFSVPYGASFYTGFVAGRDKYAGAAQASATARPAASPWALEPQAGYGVGGAILGDGLQHDLRLAAIFRHDGRWGIGPFAELGVASEDALGQTWHAALGAQLSYRLPLGADLALVPAGRAGYQLVLVDDDDQLRGDPLSARFGAELGLRYQASEAFAVTLAPGLAADLVRRADLEASTAEWYLNPSIGLRASF